MPRPAIVLASAATAALVFVGCKGFKDAMTAHLDVVARAGPQELSVDRLATLVGNSHLPTDREFVHQLAMIWVDYQLLGHAAAQDDSLNSRATMDSALWGAETSAKAKKWFDQISKSWVGADTMGYPAEYASGKVLAARHILLTPPLGDTSTAGSDSVRRKAAALRVGLTPANFATVAEKNSKDPGSASHGGDLGAFEPGQMVAPFEQALRGLKPGEISQPVHTQFGWHLIYRPTYAEAHDDVARKLGAQTMQVAEQAYIARLDSASHYKYLTTATPTVRAVTKDPEAHRSDETPIATYVGGQFTAAQLSRWMNLFPPQVRGQLDAAPDSVIPGFVRNVVRNEMVLRQADSAGVKLDSADMNVLKHSYEDEITSDWTTLGVDPKMLADSAKTAAARDRLAAAHIDDYLARMVQMTARYVDVPQPVDQALRLTYHSEINEPAVDRAVSRALEIRKTADSSRAAKAPPSAVPLPGGPATGSPVPGATGGANGASPAKKP